jgi:hypothetical protein
MRVTILATKQAAAIAITVVALGALEAADQPATKKFFSDDPLWTMPPPAATVNPTARKLSDYYDFFENTLFARGERATHNGEYLPSQGINTVDEVPDSTWYTNRHARHRMSLEELKRGTGSSAPPAPGKWNIIAAKNEGVTPGFRIRDAAGRQYFIKFDPLSNPEMASAADVITSKFFYALGYNVPENYVVYFDRSQIAIDEGAMLKDHTGRKRPIHNNDVDEMLLKAPRRPDGKYRAMASTVISGKPVGPFLYHGTRSDDPNDLVEHENRRDLRAVRTFAAWLGHDDSKALNSLDVLVQDKGVPFIKHYLIDFGASLGSASFMANSPRDGNVYLFDWKSSAAQFFSLGLYIPRWQRAWYPKLPAVGRFEYEIFDPDRWVPDYPNTAFRNENPSDRSWAARKIQAFTEDEIRAMVSTGEYTDPAATDWVARCLIERRKKIVNAYLTGMGGLDGFEIRNGRLEFRDIGPKPVAADSIQVEWAVFANETGGERALPGERSFQLPKEAKDHRYVVAHLIGPSAPSISVYVRTFTEPPLVVGIDRQFGSIQGKE